MPVQYLALGDSYTIGERVEPDGRWPVQLTAALRADGVVIDAPRIIARTGWTTGELSTAIDAAAPLGDDHALVTLLIGVNNQYRGRDVGEYAHEFAVLLERAIGFAGRRADRVVVLAIPDWGVTPFAAQSGRDTAAIARELDAYNAAAAKICARRGVAFVDIAPVSRERGAEPAMLADDGLHPSAAMYAEWARLALPVVRRLLAQSHAP
ncbi:MAG: SGNH/GDSL hydrolase family protein [Lysobacter sp.]|nr:SGNH/GDSL hydrolase family protein [Lysobacter sp.]